MSLWRCHCLQFAVQREHSAPSVSRVQVAVNVRAGVMEIVRYVIICIE